MGYNGPAPEGPKPKPFADGILCRTKGKAAETIGGSYRRDVVGVHGEPEPRRSGFLTGLFLGWLLGSGD